MPLDLRHKPCLWSRFPWPEIVIAMVSPLGSAPLWLENGSCHHPLLETDAEYLIGNLVTWTEVLRSGCLLLVSLLTVTTNILLILSIFVANFVRYTCLFAC